MLLASYSAESRAPRKANKLDRKFNTSSSQKYGEEKSNLLKGVGFLKDVVAVHFDETPPNEVNRNAHAQFRFKARKYKTVRS